MNHSTSEREFEKFVDKEVARCLSEGNRTIQEIIEQAAGIYPNDVLDSLKRLKMELSVLKTDDSDDATDTAEASQRILIPHPLDFDWRFANASLALIARFCIERTSPRDTLAFIGVPSVFRIQAKLSDRILALIDRNAHFLLLQAGLIFIRHQYRRGHYQSCIVVSCSQILHGIRPKPSLSCGSPPTYV